MAREKLSIPYSTGIWRYYKGLLRYYMKRLATHHMPAFIEAQRPHLFLYVPICFGLGIASYFGLDFEPAKAIWAGLSLGMVVLSVVLWHAHIAGNQGRQILCWAIILFVSGFLWSAVQTYHKDTIMLTKPAGPLMVTGEIESISLIKNNLHKIVLSGVTLEQRAAYETPQKIRLRSYHVNDEVAIGQRVQMLAKLMPPSRPVIPHGYDFQRRAYFEGIGAVGFTLGDINILSQTSAKGNIGDVVQRFFAEIRAYVNARIESVQSPAFAALSKALITGDRAAIRDEDYEALRSAGLAHLLAISGLHIGLVAGFVFVSIRFGLCLIPSIALRYPIKKIAAMCAIFSALFYMMMAGATIPTQRAALMSCIVFLAVILDRKAISLRLVALAAMAVLLIAPSNLLSPSFQLSFAAVTALIAFYEWWQRRRYRREVDVLFAEGTEDSPRLFESWRRQLWARPFFYCGGIMLTSVIATFATTLFAVYHFGYVHAYGLLGNVLALPIVSLFVMPVAVLSLVLWPFAFISESGLALMQYGLEWVMLIAHRIHELPLAVGHLPQMPHIVFLWLVAGLLALCVLRGQARGALCALCIVAGVLTWSLQTRETVGFIHENPIVMTLWDDGAVRLYGDQNMSRFVNEQLYEFYGLNKHDAHMQTAQEACDDFACVSSIKGRKIALIKDRSQYHRFCHDPDIRMIIATEAMGYKQECTRKDLYTLNFFDLWRYGSYHIQYDHQAQDLRIKSVEGLRGIRPWTTRGQRARIKLAAR